MTTAQENRRLIALILLAGAAILGVLAALCWTGTLPVDPGARRVLAMAFALAAGADALIGFFFLTRST